MTAWKYKLWRSVSVAAALSVAACGGEGGASQGEAGEAAAHGEAGEAAIGEGGGEHGEAGVDTAYSGVEGPQRVALRLQHLKGFLLAAAAVNDAGQTAEASVLVQQGLLEVYDPAPDQFGALDVAKVRALGDTFAEGDQTAALSALSAARPADTNFAQLTVSMVDIASGLYRGVIQPDFVDPVEYQHSLGAALAAREALVAGQQNLRARDARAYDEALQELDRFIALWPATTAPDNPTPYRDVLAESSRIRLALSPFL